MRPRSTRISPILYRGLSRNLFYYPMIWMDSNNVQHQAGYYDENGNRVDESMVEKSGTFETTYKCAYCDTEVKVQWKEGEKPNCPNCGAPLEEVVDPDDDRLQGTKQPVAGMSNKKAGCIGCGVAVLLTFISFIIVSITSTLGSGNNKVQTYPTEVSSLMLPTAAPSSSGQSQNLPSSSTLNQDEIFVEELGRICKWNDDYDSYYDKISDCYFWYNAEAKQWQYWFEDISSDYGDYGWMEYDPNDGNWYIEISDGNWIVLPNAYETSGLWHM